MAEILASALPTPAAGDGATDDSAAFNSAVAGTTVLLDGTKTYMVTNLTLANDVTLRGVSGKAIMKKVAGSTTTYMFNLTGSNQRLENLVIDGNSVIVTTANKYIMFVSGATNFQMENCVMKNSGSPDKSMGGILVFSSSGFIRNCRMTDSTVLGKQIKIDQRANKHFIVRENDLVGSQDTGIYVTNSAGGYTARSAVMQVDIIGNWIKDVTDGFSSTGQNGNAITIFQADSVNVYGNRCYNPRFSGVRVDLCADVLVHDNIVDGAQESSMYAELGAIGCRFYSNIISNFFSGINLTNVSQRTPDEMNYAYDNHLYNGSDYGIKVEHDAAYNNHIEGVPFPILVGYDGTSHHNRVYGNIITWDQTTNPKPTFGIGLCKDLVMSRETIRLNQVGTTETGRLHCAISVSDSANFSAITAANPMVTTTSVNPSPGFAVGQVYVFHGIQGMTQLNGKIGTVVAVNGSSVTWNIDSSGFGAFVAPTGGQKAPATLLYTSGTTLARTNSGW